MRVLLILLCLFSSAVSAKETLCGKNYSYLVFDVESREVLLQKDAEIILYPASLTKVMTLHLVFDALKSGKLNLDQKLVFSARGEEVSKVNKVNTLNAKEGDKISVRQAIQAVIIKSFNEAAVVLAEAVAGDEWNFARLMNKKAQELGMINSSFRNSSGLHEDGQYTTSYDLARLVISIKKNHQNFYHFFAQKKFTYRGNEYETANKIINSYEGAEGMKTGFTNAAGFNLISTAKYRDKRVGAVVMSCSDSNLRYRLSEELLDRGFDAALDEKLFAVKIANNFDYKDSTEKYASLLFRSGGNILIP
jgi:D-alanyl-D-alanine carboxypeptidase